MPKVVVGGPVRVYHNPRVNGVYQGYRCVATTPAGGKPAAQKEG
ncbi:hypothetical protein PRZ61_12265 [Halomonas pacifica]|nr:hypothetical protein [Halomonas pacifica]MDC8804216.1 hypothetical protein [Halomonas pacifica]